MERDWTKVCLMQEIPRAGARVVRTAGGRIALFRTRDDHVFALDDRCPHRGGPLSQGIVHGERVTCPLHNWCIQLDDGHAVAPDEGATACYPVRLVGEEVYISLASAPGAGLRDDAGAAQLSKDYS